MKWFPLALVGAVLALFSWFTLVDPAPIGANEASRWATIDSLIHRQTFEITESAYSWTIDSVQKKNADGTIHKYSSKPAFMAGWVSVLFTPLNWLGLDIARPEYLLTMHSMAIVLLLINVVPFLICLFYYWRYLQQGGFSQWTVLACFTFAACGTYTTGYLTTLTNHVPGALAVFGAALAFHTYAQGRFQNTNAVILAFLLAGFAAMHDVSALLFGAVLILLLAVRHPQAIKIAVPCLLLPIAAGLAVEWMATGLPLPKQVMTMMGFKNGYRLNSYWRATQGIDAIKDSIGVRFFHMSFGHHGIFSLQPAFLLGLLPALPGVRRQLREYRQLYFLLLGGSAVVFTFFLIKTTNYGGECQGMRWLFWLAPLWLMIMPYIMEVPALKKPGSKAMIVVLLAVTCFSTLSAMAYPWSSSWLHRLLNQ